MSEVKSVETTVTKSETSEVAAGLKVVGIMSGVILVLAGGTVAVMNPSLFVSTFTEVSSAVMGLFGSAPVAEVVEPAVSAAVSTL